MDKQEVVMCTRCHKHPLGRDTEDGYGWCLACGTVPITPPVKLPLVHIREMGSAKAREKVMYDSEV